MSEMEHIDPEDCRRSMRKRRKVNYNQVAPKPKCKAETHLPEPSTKKLRSKVKCVTGEKIPKIKLVEPKKECPPQLQSGLESAMENDKYPLNSTEKFVKDLIATGNRSAMEKTVKMLQDALGKTEKGKSSRSSAPLATPSAGGSIIMEGVINNQSCYLIPINIGNMISNIQPIPAIQGTSVVSPQPPMNAIQPPVPIQQQQQQQQQQQPKRTTPCAPPVVFKEYTAPQKPLIITQPVALPTNPLGKIQPTPNSSGMLSTPGGGVPKISSFGQQNVVFGHSTSTTATGQHQQPMATSLNPSPMAVPTSSQASLPFPVIDLEPEISLTATHEVSVTPGGSTTGPVKETVASTSDDTSIPEIVPSPVENNKGDDGNEILIKNILETLQSTDSLNEALGQLSQEEIMAIVSLLTESTDNNPLSAVGSEITKLISAPKPGSSEESGAVSEESGIEEDLDFHHISTPELLCNLKSDTKCVMCGLVCTDYKSFIAHTRVHTFSYRYSCYECGYGTSSMNDLLIHKSREHISDISKISPESLRARPGGKGKAGDGKQSALDTLVKCPDCSMELPIDLLPAHMTSLHKPYPRTSKTPGRKPKCTMCSAVLESKNDMNEHVNHHQKQQGLFLCFFCPQSYTTVTSLQLHTCNQHAAQACKRQHRCGECDRVFSGSYHLLRHIKTVHEQRRDYKCSKCDKSFVELHCLRRHIRNIHNLVRDHTCPVCKRGFTYRQDMFRHIMSVHQKIRDIKCPLCSEKFYHRYFIGHAAKMHDLKVKYRDGICYIYDDNGNVIHKIT